MGKVNCVYCRRRVKGYDPSFGEVCCEKCAKKLKKGKILNKLRAISDRERNWALAFVAIVAATKIPTICSLASSSEVHLSPGWLLIVPLLFIVNIAFAQKVWRREWTFGKVFLITLALSAGQFSREMSKAEGSVEGSVNVWYFSVGAARKECAALQETSVSDAIAGFSRGFMKGGGDCTPTNYPHGVALTCHKGDTALIMGAAIQTANLSSKAACLLLEEETRPLVARTFGEAK